MPRRPEEGQQFDKYGYPIPATATLGPSGYRSVSTPVPKNGRPSDPDLGPASRSISRSRTSTTRTERYGYDHERPATITRQGDRTPRQAGSRIDHQPDQGSDHGEKRYGGLVDLPRPQRIEEDRRKPHRSETGYHPGSTRGEISIAQHDLEHRLSRLRNDRPDRRAEAPESRSGGGKPVHGICRAETGARSGDDIPGPSPVATRHRYGVSRQTARPEIEPVAKHARSSSDDRGRRETRERPPGSRKTSVTFAPILEADIGRHEDSRPVWDEQQKDSGCAGRSAGDSRRGHAGMERPREQAHTPTGNFRGSEEHPLLYTDATLANDPRSNAYDHNEYLHLNRYSDVGVGETQVKPRVRTRYPPSSALMSPRGPASRISGHDQSQNSRTDMRRMGARSISSPIRSPTTGSISPFVNPASFDEGVTESVERRLEPGRLKEEQDMQMRQDWANARAMEAKTDKSGRNLGIGRPPRFPTVEVHDHSRAHREERAQSKGKGIDRVARFDPVWQKEEELREMVRETAQVRKLRDDLQRHFRVDQGAGQAGPASKRTAIGNVRFAVEPDVSTVRQEGGTGLPPQIPTKPAQDLRTRRLPGLEGVLDRISTAPAASQVDEAPPQPDFQLEIEPRAESAIAEPLAPPPPYLHEPPLVRTTSAPAIVEDTGTITPASAIDTNKLEDMEDEITCPICMSIMVAVHAVAPCGHTMCGGCGDEWFRDKDTCPICRTLTSTPRMVPLLPMDRMIDMYVRAQGEEWEGLQGWKDRRAAWEALKVVIKEEEDQRRVSASQTTAQDEAGPTIPDIPGGLGLSGWLDGEEEYRLREEESFGNPFFGHLFDEVSSHDHDDAHRNGGIGQTNLAPASPGPGLVGWTGRFSLGDFERPSFPAPGINPFMDAFGYTSHPPYTPRAQRTFSLPGLSGSMSSTNSIRRPILDGPRGWLSGMMDLVDTFTRHDHHHHHQDQRYPGTQTYRGVGVRGPGTGDLDGLEEGMARMFAELRRGR